MRQNKPSIRFLRDYKRETKTFGAVALDAILKPVIDALSNDEPLPPKNADHPLYGNWKSFRECHVKPDLLLVYRKPDSTILELARLGSHSELKI